MLNRQQLTTIEKTLLTARIFDGFWDRWKVHGVQQNDLSSIRTSFLTEEQWVQGWKEQAQAKYLKAKSLELKGLFREAEITYRTSALYYQLISWLFSECNQQKLEWMNVSLEMTMIADQLSKFKTNYTSLTIDHYEYFGRVRIPADSKGVIVIINPLDSTKEELFTYEMDFLEKGYTTISMDGPGQGQTYTKSGLKGTKASWERFVDGLIDFAYTQFFGQPIYLFGTSSGAAWAIYGSCDKRVSKVVAVSPAFRNVEIHMPDYFVERTKYVLEEDIVPNYYELPLKRPVFLIHGKKDVMVKDEDIEQLFERLPEGKLYLEFREEGHCCNYELSTIRQKATKWFEGKWGNSL